MFVDPWTWMAYLAGFDFAFGTRIHGNITALISGTPGYLFAHDSRTLELARYFDIPHRLMKDVPADVDAAQLYAEADYTALNAGHKARYERIRAFLARHDLGQRVRRRGQRDPVRRAGPRDGVPAGGPTGRGLFPEELLTRVQWLRDRNAALGEDVRELREQRLRARVRRAVGAPVRRILNR